MVGTVLPCGDRRELAHDELPVHEQGFHRHMSNNTGFMNFPIETAAAFP